MRTVSLQGDIARPGLLALLALALTFLNFGHTSAVFAAGGRVVVTASSICGDPVTPSGGDHFTCHACRQDAAALPPPPSRVEPTVFCITPVAYAALVPAALAAPLLRTASPRAPPAGA